MPADCSLRALASFVWKSCVSHKRFFPTSYGAYQKSSGLLRCLGDMLGAAMPPAALPPHGNSSHVWIAYVEYDQEASYT